MTTPTRRLWPLLARAGRCALMLAGLAAIIVAAAVYALDASPLDNFEVRFSWVRGGDRAPYRGQLDGQPAPPTLKRWPR